MFSADLQNGKGIEGTRGREVRGVVKEKQEGEDYKGGGRGRDGESDMKRGESQEATLNAI